MVTPIPHVLRHRPRHQHLLQRLHQQSLDQEKELKARATHYPGGVAPTEVFQEQLVALDEDKARDMYLLLRAMGATRVIEAGTSHGVSLLWMLAAVEDNKLLAANSQTGTRSNYPPLVIGTENEPTKARIALDHVTHAFETRPPYLNLLEGDLLQTIPAQNLPDGSIDCLLLDIWAPLALPTLKLVVPKLRKGGIVLIDNTVSSAERYADLLEYLRNDGSGFQCSTLPHEGGFELCFWTGI